MKISMIKIFNNLSLMLILNFIVATILTFFILEQNFSYKKIDNLDQQKKLIKELFYINDIEKELIDINFNSKSKLLLIKIDKLQKLYNYDYIGKFIINSKDEYLNDLKQLKNITLSYNQSVKEFIDNKISKKELIRKYIKITNKINDLYIKNVKYNKEKTKIISEISGILLFVSLITTFWYRRRLKLLKDEILHLSSIQSDKKNYKIKTLEAGAIELRMRKKSTNETIEQNLLDPITNVLNTKGLKIVYNQKKNLMSKKFTSVTLIEIDNLSKKDKKLSQELIQNILKKVASSISLFEQTTDIVARVNYNQFIIILSRGTKEQCFKDIELIKENISEIKYKLDDGKYKNITLSGGFIIKPNNKSLDESIKEAKKLLEFAKTKGGNKITQPNDLHQLDV